MDRRKYQEEFEELANIEIRNPILTRQRECWTVINIPGNSIELGEEIFAYKPVQIDMFNGWKIISESYAINFDF